MKIEDKIRSILNEGLELSVDEIVILEQKVAQLKAMCVEEFALLPRTIVEQNEDNPNIYAILAGPAKEILNKLK